MDKEILNDKEEWIIVYISKLSNQATDILDSQFVNDYITKFKPKFTHVNWGAHKCKEISRLLAGLYKKGYLTRFSIGLGTNWQPGFPRWVYSYELPKE